MLLSLLMLPVLQAFADDYADTVDLFRNALEDRTFVGETYGYAVFPTVGKGLVSRRCLRRGPCVCQG